MCAIATSAYREPSRRRLRRGCPSYPVRIDVAPDSAIADAAPSLHGAVQAARLNRYRSRSGCRTGSAHEIAAQRRRSRLEREDDCDLGSVLETVFAHDVADMRTNRIFGNFEFICDVLVLHSPRDQHHEFCTRLRRPQRHSPRRPLARGQGALSWCVGWEYFFAGMKLATGEGA